MSSAVDGTESGEAGLKGGGTAAGRRQQSGTAIVRGHGGCDGDKKARADARALV